MIPQHGAITDLTPGASPQHMQDYWGDLCGKIESQGTILTRMDARLSDLVELSRRRKALITRISLAESGKGAEYELKLYSYVHSRLYVTGTPTIQHNALGIFVSQVLVAGWNILDFPDDTKISLPAGGGVVNALLKLSDYEGV